MVAKLIHVGTDAVKPHRPEHGGRRRARTRSSSSPSAPTSRSRPRPLAGFLDLPERSSKPRERGLTHVLDKGLSCAEVDGLIEVAGPSVDLVKLGWGTALVTAQPRAQAARYARADVPGRARRHADRDRAARRAHRRAGRVAARAGHPPRRGLRRHDRDRAHREARPDPPRSPPSSRSSARSAPRTREEIMAPYRWVEQIEAELEAGRVEGDHRVARDRQRRHLPPRRRGPHGPDRRDRPRGRRRQAAVRGAAQGAAGVVPQALRARGQPRQHRARTTCCRWRRCAWACAPTPWASCDLAGPPRPDGLQPRAPLPGPPAGAAGRHAAASRRTRSRAQAAQREWAALWCSPLERALETARIVGAAIGHRAASRTRASPRPTAATGPTARSTRCEAEDPEGFRGFITRRPGLRVPRRRVVRAAGASACRHGLDDVRAGALPALVVCHRGVMRLALDARARARRCRRSTCPTRRSWSSQCDARGHGRLLRARRRDVRRVLRRPAAQERALGRQGLPAAWRSSAPTATGARTASPISFYLKKADDVTVDIVDDDRALVRTLVADRHSLRASGSAACSGTAATTRAASSPDGLYQRARHAAAARAARCSCRRRSPSTTRRRARWSCAIGPQSGEVAPEYLPEQPRRRRADQGRRGRRWTASC